MKITKKNYLLTWGLIGLADPIVMLLIARYAPFGDHARRLLAALLSPMILVVYGLSLMVTDGGGPAHELGGTVIFAIAILLNAGMYVGSGFVSWPIAKPPLNQPHKTS